MKTRNNMQWASKKVRKQIVSVTLNQDVIAESVTLDEEGNFSRYVGKALEEYNKKLKEQKDGQSI